MRRSYLMIALLILSLSVMFTPAGAAGWTAEVVARLDLTAGAGASAAFLAPDGSRFAYFKADDLCLYTLEGEQGDCIELADDISIDLESVRWSPDSSKLAFSESFLITFRDSDIWVYDAETNALTDLTPAPNRELKLFGNDDPDAVFTVDLAPQWATDSQSIYFLRYQFKKSNEARAMFYRVGVDGGEPELVAPVDTNSTISTYGFAVSADESRIVYNLDTRGDEQDGTWFLDVETGEAKFAAAAVQDTLPWAYQFSASGDLVLVVGASMKMNAFSDDIKPDDSAIYTLPMSGGRQQQLDTDAFVYAAGWGLEGSTLAYTTYDRANEDLQGLYITNAPGQKGEMVLAGRFILTTPRQQVPLMWAANNTLLLTDMENFDLVVVRLSEG